MNRIRFAFLFSNLEVFTFAEMIAKIKIQSIHLNLDCARARIPLPVGTPNCIGEAAPEQSASKRIQVVDEFAQFLQVISTILMVDNHETRFSEQHVESEVFDSLLWIAAGEDREIRIVHDGGIP